MGEQEKILMMINRWGYLNSEQIALLLNKNQNTIERLLDYHAPKGFYKIDQHTRKNIYYLSHKGNSFVGREHKKSIKISCYELQHQDILDLVHNYNILCRLNYKIHFYLCIYLTFVFHLKNNYQNSR